MPVFIPVLHDCAPNWVDIATAIGTVGAVVVAVAIALFHKWFDELVHGRPQLFVKLDAGKPARGSRAIRMDTPAIRIGFALHRVLVENKGRASALEVRALLSGKVFPNPVPLRWSGTVGEGEEKSHLPPKAVRRLDVLEYQKPGKDFGGIAYVVTLQAVLEQNDLRPFKLPIGQAYEFELELFTVDRLFRRYAVTIDLTDGANPQLSVKVLRLKEGTGDAGAEVPDEPVVTR